MFHIAGVIPFTTIDFPDNLAGVIFFKGCPLKCPFCHNPALQELSEGDETWENVCGATVSLLGLLAKIKCSICSYQFNI